MSKKVQSQVGLLSFNLLEKYQHLSVDQMPSTLETTRQAFNRLNDYVYRYKIKINLNWIYTNILKSYALEYFRRGQFEVAANVVEHIIFIRLMKCTHINKWYAQIKEDFFSLFLLRLFASANEIRKQQLPQKAVKGVLRNF